MIKQHFQLIHNTKSWPKILNRSLSSQVYDFVVSGGGMVGTAAAATLGKHLEGKKVLLLESSEKKEYQTPSASSYSNRVSALSPASRRLLKDIGAWKHIEESGRFKPVKSMYVWEHCSNGKITFTQPADTGHHLAYLVENDLTVHSLSNVLTQEYSHTVEIAYNTAVTKYYFPSSQSAEPATVHLSNGETVSARLVIGADGFQSLARQSAEIPVVSWKYDQVGVVATLRLNPTEEGNVVAWQKFFPSGPIAILPLSDDTSSLVWSTSMEHAKHLLSLDPESFVDELNHALNDESGKDEFVSAFSQKYQQVFNSLFKDLVSDPSPRRLPPTVLDIDSKSRAMFPFGLMHADRYVAPRLAIVGDSCHRVHPLAGQGVNLGFGDVECLIKNLHEAVLLGADVGKMLNLVEYETERQRHVISLMAGIDGLYRLYSNDSTIAVLARSLGLSKADTFTPLKTMLSQHAQA